MIDYYKGLFGLNLIFRIHGSIIIKAIVPGLISLPIYFAVVYAWKEETGSGATDLNHPYAIGVLVGSASIIITFRANQGYDRVSWSIAASLTNGNVSHCYCNFQCSPFVLIRLFLGYCSFGKHAATFIV